MTASDDEPVADRRRSGRTIRRPELFADGDHYANQSPATAPKRKRASNLDGVANRASSDAEMPDSEDEQSSDSSDSEAEELEQRSKAKAKRGSVVKPAAKRPKTTNGTSTTLAIRSAGAPPSTTVKSAKLQKARSRPSQVHATGLYAEVFGQGNSAEDAASEWNESLQKDNVAGIRDLVNFILQCVGCDAQIETADIEDIDNVPSKLGDIVEEYTQQNSTDYPLSSKLKQHAGFREVLIEFFNAVMHTLHNSGMLYDEPAVYDNIHIWTATMSGAGFRSFRHTATIVSLSMCTALCEIAQNLQTNMATSKTQIDTEKKKKSANKSRLAKLQEEMKQEEARLSHVDELLRDAFDTVFVHRYRDVDEKIRVECVAALGKWIVLYRKMFLEGQYLRYLGWLLSDPNTPTRLEVVRSLRALFKGRGSVAALRAFVDRFRPRIVEMGSRDTDVSVRVESIELLDRLRNAELLEPDDIDTIGQLIFDNELRVRKAVAKFFVSNINDLYLSQVGELDEEQYSSALPTVDESDDFQAPCQSWIKFKCLAQTLAAHDSKNDSRENGERHQEIYATENVESRYMLATQSIYPYMPDLQHWESLAGYLLFDHSAIPATIDDSDINQSIQNAFKLDNGEDTILLDVLHFAAKLYLQQVLESRVDTKGKRAHVSKNEIQSKRESMARSLTMIIPQLLNKFGGTPEAAASILRLQQLLDMNMIHDSQPGEAGYTQIIEGINQQFSSHNDRKVLAEASKALRAARTFETSQEAVDAKVAEIWTESKEALNSLLQNKNVPNRGTIDRNVLGEVGDVLERLGQLAAVSDCTEFLESRLSHSGARKSKSKTTSIDSLLDALMQLVKRGVADDDTTAQFNELEDRISDSVLTLLSFYFRWKVVNLKNAIAVRDTKSFSENILRGLAMQRSNFVESITPVITSRQPLDTVRVSSIITALDLFILFATVRHMRPNKGDLSDSVQSSLSSLSTAIPVQVMALIMETHEKMEKRLARKTKKRIDLPLENRRRKSKARRTSGGTHDTDDEAEITDDDIEKPPEDSDDEAEDAPESSDDGVLSDEDEHESGVKGREARKQAALVAEQSLCELVSKLVLVIIAGISDRDGKTKARIQLNRSRLGKNYAQIIAYLDEKKSKPKPKPKATLDGQQQAQMAGDHQAATTPRAATATTATMPSKPAGTSSSRGKPRISEPLVLTDDDITDHEEEEQARSVEEGDEEDLRRRGLDDDNDDVIDDDEETNERNDKAVNGDENHDDDHEDEVMGD